MPYFSALRRSVTQLSLQSPAPYTLPGLLAGSPPTQHDLAVGVYEQRQAQVLSMQPDDRHRARFLSAGGTYAGHWLNALPGLSHLTASGPVYRLALCLRLGAPIAELAELTCQACSAEHDAFGFHPSSCPRGNRGNLLSRRGSALEYAVQRACRLVGQPARLCTSGAYWLGSVAWRPGRDGGEGGYLRPDVVLPHYRGPISHYFLDAAVTCPSSVTALRAGSARAAAAAAAAKEARKVAKYEDVCERVGSAFCPAVVERFGACGERLAGFIGMISGSGDRDVCDDDYVFSTSSRTTYTATSIVFAAVIADAAMLHDVIEHDGHRRALDRDDSGAYAQPPRPRGCAVPGQYAAPRARRAARYHPYARPT